MRKDLTTKQCLSDNERYADLINGAVISLENQDKVHYLMPLRNMAYEASEYDRQAEALQRQVRKLPDITEEESQGKRPSLNSAKNSTFLVNAQKIVYGSTGSNAICNNMIE